MTETVYDAVVVGGGPSGATIATDLAREGHRVLLLDRAGRIKPCGGAVPPRLLKDFEIPHHLLVARARSARMCASSASRASVSPSSRRRQATIGSMRMSERTISGCSKTKRIAVPPP